jgi:hypothetical protein
MAFPTTFSHVYTQTAATPEGTLQDGGVTTSGDTIIGGYWTINATGGGANAIVCAFPATGFQSAVLYASVPVVVTLTGVTIINGVTTSDVTLTAAAPFLIITAITGACTAISIAASSGASAGKLSFSVVYNS